MQEAQPPQQPDAAAADDGADHSSEQRQRQSHAKVPQADAASSGADEMPADQPLPRSEVRHTTAGGVSAAVLLLM